MRRYTFTSPYTFLTQCVIMCKDNSTFSLFDSNGYDGVWNNLLFMYSYCCLCILIVVYVFLDVATLTEVFPCFFLGCKANARV